MASILNYSHTQWQNTNASVKIQQRNEKYRGMAAMGHDAHRIIIHTPKQMQKLMSLVSTHMEDGKIGHRMYISKKIHDTLNYPFKIFQKNTLIYNFKSSYVIKSLKEVKHVEWDTQNYTVKELLKSLKEAQQWQLGMQKYDEKRGIVASSKYNGYNEYGNSYGVLEFIVGKYRGVACKGCGRPHYESIVKPDSFHACTYCGMLYKHSNIQMVAQLRTNDEGEQVGFHHAAPGMTTDPFVHRGKRTMLSYYNQEYQVKADNRIKTMISCICDNLNCDTGDGELHIRIWAWKKYEQYSKWLQKESKWEGIKNKMGKWQIAASFVWMSILSYEARIYQSTIWSLSTICKEAAALQEGDAYIPNYNRRKRKVNQKVRTTRKIKLETVHRYADEISKEFPNFQKLFGITIPHINSIEVSRGTNVNAKEATDLYTKLQGKTSFEIPLPPNLPWDLDIINDGSLIIIKPDINGLGFKLGLVENDILRTINGHKCPKTVDETYAIVQKCKSKKIKTSHGVTIKPIILTVLR